MSRPADVLRPGDPPGPDLEVLRRAEGPAPVPGGRSPWLARLTLWIVAVGLLGLGYALLEPILFPPRPVTLAAVRAAGEGAGGVPQGAVRVEAAGWIEARPFPVSVRPLVSGIVERLEVLEGQRVERDRTRIAVLRNLDVENALVEARSALGLAEALVAEAQADEEVARAILEQRLEARGRRVTAEGLVAVATAREAEARAQVAAAAADLAEARVDRSALEDLARAGGDAPAALERARAREAAAHARWEATRAGLEAAQRERAQAEAERAVAVEGAEDPRGLAGDLRRASAGRAVREADLVLARTRLQIAERNAQHLEVRAPMDGVVMRVDCAPGARVGPEGDFKGEAEGKGSTGLLNRATGVLVTLYDPAQLQARVDVPYAEVVGLQAGDPVELEPHALPGHTLAGRVDRLVHEADINKAMLQVKVEIEDPDPRLRPEMLVKARFVRRRSAETAAAGGPLRWLVPATAVRGDAVFVLDPRGGGRARRVPVRVLEGRGDLAVVEGDLGLSSKVILDAVVDGERVEGELP